MSGSPGKRRRRRWAAIAAALLAGAASSLAYLTVMPGSATPTRSVALDEAQQRARARLTAHVEVLAGEIVARDMTHPEQLAAARDYILASWQEVGYETVRRGYEVDGSEVDNLEVVRVGATRPAEIVLVGAHYDSADGLPGADDNASGVAALLELSRRYATRETARTLRFVAFVNEEPPHFQTATMGSVVYARESRRLGEDVVGMLSLETIGYFRDESGSQLYPFPFAAFYPDRGDFVGFVGEFGSASFVRDAIASFRARAAVPSRGVIAPSAIPGIGWSDHWSFAESGYPALMITDTAPFRNPNYHTAGDRPETLDYERLTLVVDGVEAVIDELVMAR